MVERGHGPIVGITPDGDGVVYADNCTELAERGIIDGPHATDATSTHQPRPGVRPPPAVMLRLYVCPSCYHGNHGGCCFYGYPDAIRDVLTDCLCARIGHPAAMGPAERSKVVCDVAGRAVW
jgi:hypothetical protein